MENLATIAAKLDSFSVAAPISSGFINHRQRRCAFYPPLRSQRLIFRKRTNGIVAAFGFGRRNSGGGSREVENAGKETLEVNDFARISSPNNSQMTTSTSSPLVPRPPSSSYIGSPLLWIGVGVGLSVIFQVVAARVKRYAMQQAFKTMMDQAAPQNTQFNNPMFSPGSQFPFPPVSSPSPSTPPFTPAAQASSQPVLEINDAVSEVKATASKEDREEPEVKETQKKYAFVDVSPEEISQSERSYSKEFTKESVKPLQPEIVVPSNGTIKQEKPSNGQSQFGRSTPPISVEALEKMMEDPTVQKMVYPYLPEEMRNPTSFKWMMQNPQFRQQMHDMLSNMGGSAEWDNRMMDSLKNFDLSSPEVKQQFEQIGLTPEEVISKIMANPDVAMAFQNPKVQAAILDCSQNPLSIAKYQNDKEVMDVFTKISELFPGVTGYP